MSEYTIIGFSFLLLSFLYHEHLIKVDRSLIILILFLISLFIVGCRYNIGTDWGSYVNFYYSGYAEDKSDGKTEFLFQNIRNFSYFLGLTHALFFAILSFFSLYVLFIASRNFDIKNIYLVYLVYFCYVFCNLQFNIVRHGLLTSCVMLSYSYKAISENKKALLWAFIGCGFHSAGFLFLITLFKIDYRIKRKYAMLILFLSSVFYIFGIGQKIIEAIPFLGMIDRFAGYTDLDKRPDEDYGLSLGLIFNILLFIYLYFIKFKKSYFDNARTRVLLNCLLLSIALALTLNVFGAIVGRISNVFTTTLIFIWPLLFQSMSNRLPKYIIGLFFFLYLYLFFQKTIQANPETSLSPMYPYKMRIEQLYSKI